ncbi:hypothetical protein E1265_26650 [Streptomyces sp. 8K308]|uniref:hypothetical protein n=1 Tax=Streptomyces sp. 8K308 TaxID=2530388 RepID=UPI0010510EE4|nr:hypothetical protein [Streptomyces sp. 8K308]TDC15481.1 hypothetical protein E1265_26650 [Streptomyces sp. 8K308]
MLALSACGGDGGGSAEPRDDAEPTESAATEGLSGLAGPADMEPEELLRLADETLRGAESFTADMSQEVGGTSLPAGDLLFTTGERCTSNLYSAEGNVEVIQDADDLWVRMSPETLALIFDEAQVQQLANRYLHGSADDPALADWAEMCERGGLPVALLEGQPAEYGVETTSLTVEAVSDHHGTPVVTVRREESGDGSAVTSTVLIAAEGEPYPLRTTSEMEFEDGSTMVNVTDYARFNAELPFHRPSDDFSVEADELDLAVPQP